MAQTRITLHEEAHRGHPRQEGLSSEGSTHDDRVPAHVHQREHQRQAGLEKPGFLKKNQPSGFFLFFFGFLSFLGFLGFFCPEERF